MRARETRRGGRVAGAAASVALALAASPTPALGHPGRPVEPHDLWTAWSAEPASVLLLALSALLYARGARRLGRRSTRATAARRRDALLFWTGWSLLAVALVSPLHALGGALFSAHMVQHELLVALAAPLLVAARPAAAMLWALPGSPRAAAGRAAGGHAARAAWRLATHPLVAFVVHAAVLWGWHLPGPYQATLRSELVHALQHAGFLAAAGLFWWSVLHARPSSGGAGAAVASLFATTMHTGALGALLTLTERPWYPSYGRSAWAWGLTPLEDQQLAGLVMWIPACLAYVAAALWIARRWLVEPDADRLARPPVVRAAPAAVAARGGEP